MTATNERAGELARPVDTVEVVIDDVAITVPKNTLIIRAAEQLGIQIPRFCDHPLLDPVGACRQCIVEVEGQRKPVTACTTTVMDGMVVKTQVSSPVAAKAQAGTLELLLINHPLDCPVCDKGGECPLQNQALTNGYATSRFRDEKRTYEKPIAISSQVLLDRERCVLCARCTRFSQQIAGDPFIELFERGALEQVAIYADEPFESYFSGNTIQICPVGALTSTAYRFRARPFDLMSTPSMCEHCASGCALRTDWRRGRVLRRLAGSEPEVNEEWNCDKGRFAFRYAALADRLTTPLVRDAEGYLQPASWTEALTRAADGLARAVDRGGVGVLPGGRLTVEDAYAYAKFARVVLGTHDVDFRARPHSAEELDFLGSAVVGRYGETTYADLEAAPAVLLAGFEPEEESPIVFLRLRKAARKGRLAVYAVGPFVTPSVTKTRGRLLQTPPGGEAALLRSLAGAGDGAAGDGAGGEGGPADPADPAALVRAAAAALRQRGAVVLVGERLATVPGALSAAVALAEATGARLAWVPRRAGDRGALDVGAVPTLLPGGRPVVDAAARADLAAGWGIDPGGLGARPGRQVSEIVEAARTGALGGLLIGGVDPEDLPDPAAAYEALAAVGFVVSLEVRQSAVTERADVVLPVAPPVEKSGSYLDWEGRPRTFEASLRGTGALHDGRVLHTLAEHAGRPLGLPDVVAARAEIARLGVWTGPRPPAPAVPPAALPAPGAGEALLATWHWLLDRGRMQDGEPYLAGTAKRPRLHLSPATAAEIGAIPGEQVTVSTDRGSVTLPLVPADLPDRVVWLPTNSADAPVRRALGVDAGAVVRISAWGAA